MSGIAGIVDYKGQVPLQTEVLRRMSQHLAHRGPDGNGLWAVEHMAFAHRRLVTLDGESDQPMTRRVEGRTYTVMLDGNIYNAEELKRELEACGYTFRGYSEAETVLYAYIQWGEEFVHRLNGVFSIALADVEKCSVLLIRDHMGVKPLFYCLRQEALIFASELKALLALLS